MDSLEDRQNKLDGNFNAADWAEVFVATVREHPSIPTDEGTMIAWFANAIMAGFDHARTHPHPLEPEGPGTI